MVARYDLLLILSLTQYWLLYEIFTPLTLYPLLWILQLFTSASLLPLTATIETSQAMFSLVPACIGGSAYYLLCILNLTTPMTLAQRWKSLLFVIGTFFILNLVRLLIFAYMFTESFPFTSELHIIVWYVLSVILVVGIWFFNVYLFKIKNLPLVDDFSELWSLIRKKKET